jgi:hypothetical protein
MERFIFPRWSNKVVPIAIFLGLGPLGTAAIAGLWYYGTNKHVEVGYQPTQPVPYSHKLHAGDMGMDCRYCHNTVEVSPMAAVPPTETCMNCHWEVRKDSVNLLRVRESYAMDKPIPWVRVHNLPDYAYFDHSAHLGAGVGCATCHGRVDQMVKVIQTQPLSMSWCINCHREPGQYIRPSYDLLTKMDWKPEKEQLEALERGEKPRAPNGRVVNPPTWCSGCHR